MATLKYELTYAAHITIEGGCAIDGKEIALSPHKVQGENKYKRDKLTIYPGDLVQVIICASGTVVGEFWQLKYWIDGVDQTPDGPITKEVGGNGWANYNYRRKWLY